jgi:hypothetical protein
MSLREDEKKENGPTQEEPTDGEEGTDLEDGTGLIAAAR